MNKRIITKSGEILTSSLSDECCACITKNNHNGYAQINCPKDLTNKRIGYISNNNGQLYACSDHSKTTKNFKDSINVYSSYIYDLQIVKRQVVEEVSKNELQRVRRVVHNLRSINAHCIQELYNFIPQERFTHNINSTIDIVKDAIKKNNKDAALTFLRIAKFNGSMKAEFSVYEKLLKDNPVLTPRSYKLRDVIMIVLHMFFGDFSSVSVRVVVDEYYEKVLIDFESMQVAFYHIIENAAKYIKPHTEMNVKFSIQNEYHIVEFEMISMHLCDEDIDKMFNEGYSGINAKKSGKSGEGIGMYRVKNLIELNNAIIEIKAGDKILSYNDIDYSNNSFIIKIPIK
ncbi:hypothetical protein [Bacteroides xylanisolvens]|uniref:hypothetical protein n=1 Tax=Bacteroides xylanisolvens TaxID=371601 RepID=UPI0039B62F0D